MISTTALLIVFGIYLFIGSLTAFAVYKLLRGPRLIYDNKLPNGYTEIQLDWWINKEFKLRLTRIAQGVEPTKKERRLIAMAHTTILAIDEKHNPSESGSSFNTAADDGVMHESAEPEPTRTEAEQVSDALIDQPAKTNNQAAQPETKSGLSKIGQGPTAPTADVPPPHPPATASPPKQESTIPGEIDEKFNITVTDPKDMKNET